MLVLARGCVVVRAWKRGTDASTEMGVWYYGGVSVTQTAMGAWYCVVTRVCEQGGSGGEKTEGEGGGGVNGVGEGAGEKGGEEEEGSKYSEREEKEREEKEKEKREREEEKEKEKEEAAAKKAKLQEIQVLLYPSSYCILLLAVCEGTSIPLLYLLTDRVLRRPVLLMTVCYDAREQYESDGTTVCCDCPGHGVSRTCERALCLYQ
eukprot:3406995-Rhodomonas_salina.1